MAELPSEKEQLQNRIDRKEAELKDFQDRPQEQIDARMTELAGGIKQTTVHPTEKGERCMHTHLKKLKAGLERDPNAWVRHRIDSIKTEIDRLQKELNNL